MKKLFLFLVLLMMSPVFAVGEKAEMATDDTLYTFTLTSSQEKVEEDLVALAAVLSSSELK